MPTTYLTDSISEGTERHEFGFTDTKGRAVGCFVTFLIEVYGETPTTRVREYNIPAGTYYCWVGVATRAGVAFGAGQTYRHCKTEAERYAAVAAYLKAAKARATRQFNRAPRPAIDAPKAKV